MQSEIAIACQDVGKCFQLYRHRTDWLSQVFTAWGNRQYYKPVWALRGVGFEIRRGEGVGIIGRNGSGKTTLLQMICGITMPSEGRIMVDGSVAPILALGSVFDYDLPGRENTRLACAVLGMSRRETMAKLDAIADFAGIGDFYEQPVRMYSSGMASRLAFSICAHAEADIMIVDEALSVGDGAFAQKCMAFLADFRAKGGTLLFVSHSLDQVRSLCDRAIWIDRGAVRMDGDPDALVDAYWQALRDEPEPERQFTFDA